MKSIKVTAAQLAALGRQLPKSKHVACPARHYIGVVSQYTRTISYKSIQGTLPNEASSSNIKKL